jgi:hypothetical protein
MSHLVEPCVHFSDCTWDCGRGDLLGGGNPHSSTAQTSEAAKVIQRIVIYTTSGQPVELDFTSRKDPDLLVFSDQVFYNLVYDGVSRRQGRFVAEEIARALREKPALGESALGSH